MRAGFVDGAAWGLVSGAVVAGAVQLRARRSLVLGWLVVEVLVMPRRRWEPVSVERLTRASPIARTIRGEPHGRVSLRVDMADPGGPWCEAEDPEVEAERVVLDSRQRLSVLRFLEEGLWSTSGYGFREPRRLERAFEAGRPAFQLAGVTHAVRNQGVPMPFDGPVPDASGISDLWVWRVPDAFPRSWIVHQVREASDAEAWAELGARHDAPAKLAIVHRPVTVTEPEPGCTSRVLETIDVSPERVSQRVEACASGLLVLGDAWFPGWAVEVDGVRREPVRVWGFLRGVEVDEGPHRVEWRYRPLPWRLGLGLSALAWAGVLGVLLRRRTI